MQDAWNARWPLGSRSRKAERELFIDAPEHAEWQPLARYNVTTGRIGVEVVDVVLAVDGFAATPADIQLRSSGADHGPLAGQIAADRGDMLEFYMSPRIAAAVARDWTPEGPDTRRLTVRFDFWSEARGEREELVVDLQPRLQRLDHIALGIEPRLTELRLPAPASGSAADRVDLCDILATLPPEARLLRGRIAHSHVAVDIAAADPTISLLVGDSLTLTPDAADRGVGDVPAVRHSHGGWSFPLRSLIDVAFPSRQRLSLDAAVINRALPNLAGFGLAARLPITIMVRHTLAFDDDGDGADLAERTGEGTFALDLVYDLSPSFFLEVPGPSMAVALFEKRQDETARPAPRITVPLPPPGDPRGTGAGTPQRSDIALAFLLRVIGGTGGHVVQPWYHLDGVHDQYQHLPQIAFPTGLDGQAVPPAPIHVPIGPFVERHARTGQRSGRVNLYFQRLPVENEATDTQRVSIEVDLERPRSGALLCIDWGASSIAAGFTDDRNPQQVLALPLGEVYRQAAGLGGRARAARDGATLLDEDMPDLIPSRLSLSSGTNFRAALNRFSYLDLRAGGDQPAAVERRILSLDRHYDITLPAPSAGGTQGAGALTLQSLKMLLAENRDRLPLTDSVLTRDADDRVVRAQEINIPDVMVDCLDEIRGFYLTESLRFYGSRDRRRSADLERAVSAGDLRIVLTHPCGLGRNLIARYRDAGRAMLARLDRGLLPASPLSADPGTDDKMANDGVVLVPESLAAAFFVLRTELSQPRSRIAERPARLIALDFGAGTFDVSVLDVTFRRGGIESWDVKCHYGVRIGGLDIDRALYQLIDGLLEHLLTERADVAYAHPIETQEQGASDAGADPDRHLSNSRFARELELAKRSLTAEIYKVAANGGDWIWEPGRRLRVTVGRVGEQGWPVQVAAALATGPIAATPDGAATLGIAREATESGTHDLVVLEIENIFTAEAALSFEAAPRVAAALSELASIASTVTSRLPEASLAWLEERGHTAPPGAATYLSITGRASLWPPVFTGFQDLAARIGADLIGATSPTGRPAPMAPELMKKAVMLGAYYLARFPQFLDKPIPAAPLAVRFIPILSQSGPDATAGRVAYVEDLVQGGTTGTIDHLDSTSLLQLSRVVPGVEKLADLAMAGGPALWSDLMPSALNPASLTVSRTLPPRIDLEIERNDMRDVSAVTFKADWQDRRRISDDGSTFISERQDRHR